MADELPNAAQIYERVWREAAPAPALGEPFARERRTLEIPTAALARLRQEFPDDDLVRAGIAVRDSDGELLPAPALRGAMVEMVALREHFGQPPFDLLTPAGCLCGTTPATMLRDHMLRNRVAEQGWLFVALTWSDWKWCEAAGVAALYCPGAESLTVPLLREVAAESASPVDSSAATGGFSASEAPNSDCDDAGGPAAEEPDRNLAEAAEPAAEQPQSASPDAHGTAALADDSPRGAEPGEPQVCDEQRVSSEQCGRETILLAPPLAVVAWSPSDWNGEMPLGLAAQLSHLCTAERLVPLGLPEVVVWSPGDDERDELAIVMRYGDAVQRRDAVFASVETAGRVLSSLTADAPPKNFPAARAAYRQALRPTACGASDQHELLASKSLYDHFLQHDLIRPLLELGTRSDDPLARARYATAAELCELFHQLAPLAAAQAGANGDHMRYVLALAKALIGTLKSRE